MKRKNNDTKSDNGLQQMTTSGTMSGNEWYNGWLQRMTTNDNEWLLRLNFHFLK